MVTAAYGCGHASDRNMPARCSHDSSGSRMHHADQAHSVNRPERGPAVFDAEALVGPAIHPSAHLWLSCDDCECFGSLFFGKRTIRDDP